MIDLRSSIGTNQRSTCDSIWEYIRRKKGFWSNWVLFDWNLAHRSIPAAISIIIFFNWLKRNEHDWSSSSRCSNWLVIHDNNERISSRNVVRLVHIKTVGHRAVVVFLHHVKTENLNATNLDFLLLLLLQSNNDVLFVIRSEIDEEEERKEASRKSTC
jgi:hypothetical protein